MNLERMLGVLGGERRINYALDRFREALQSLGNPERDVYPLIIGGTNGKGTTALQVAASLTLAGFRTAAYLSPHLVHPRERFLLDMRPIDEAELTGLAAELFPTGQKFGLSYFEFLTLVAFVWAKRREARFLVLEVGLGGRLDATNVAEPIACAITNVSFDHMDYLGDSLEQILDEKMGILRRESLVFTGIREPALLDRLEKRCLELDAVYYFSRELRIEARDRAWNGQTALVNGYPFRLPHPGESALANAALSFLMMRIVFPRIPIATLQAALAAVRNPARFETVSESPRVILSGDHNPAGMADLVATLETLSPSRVRVVCGFSPDKPYRAMHRTLSALSDDVTLVPVSRARAPMPDDYPTLGKFEESPKRAVEAALARCDRSDTLLVTGSLYLAGEIRPLFKPEVTFWEDPRS